MAFIIFLEKEFMEISTKLQSSAKHEKRTPFCKVIGDNSEEIQLDLRFEKKNGRKNNTVPENIVSLFGKP